MSGASDRSFRRQDWRRDRDEPCIALGRGDAFDNMHVFAPCVAFEEGRYTMWYCGSGGRVAERVFRLGLATSRDGVRFEKHPRAPVFGFDDSRSVLTPALLCAPDGSTLRENGRLRMWFAAASFRTGDGTHRLHEISSADGVAWSRPSDAQLDGIYAPSVIKQGDVYHLWYVDVSADPWCIRHGSSGDGRAWKVERDPVLVLDQAWEHNRLFYPCVRRVDDVYGMWYGSYQAPDTTRTALGFAVSEDGSRWRKSPANPVFGPEPAHDWESNFTTSESIMRLPDGSWRMWYASRTKPPFVHKYFAIGTARWEPWALDTDVDDARRLG